MYVVFAIRFAVVVRCFLVASDDWNEPLHQLFIDFKKSYDSIRRKVLYNILIEFGILLKQLKLIKMW
jgi:hypothetical protein